MSSLDYLDLCRLCLVKDRVSVPIFEGEGDVRQIFLKIAACLPVKVAREDKLPKKICDDCVYKVELFYQFWNTTANAEKQLLQWLGEVGLEDKQGYVTSVLNPSVMKQEQTNENRLDGNVMQQVSGHQNNMGMGMMDNMGLGMPMMMSTANQPQITSVPMDTSGSSVQNVQAVPGPSTQTTHEQIPQNQTSTTQQQQQEDEEESSEEDENSDEECDGDEGLPVKEESEEDPNNSRTIEPTTFVNVSLACDEAGPSGLQQQKIAEMPEMSMPQAPDDDPKSGSPAKDPLEQSYLVVQSNGQYYLVPMGFYPSVKIEPQQYSTIVPTNVNTLDQKRDPIIEEIVPSIHTKDPLLVTSSIQQPIIHSATTKSTTLSTTVKPITVSSTAKATTLPTTAEPTTDSTTAKPITASTTGSNTTKSATVLRAAESTTVSSATKSATVSATAKRTRLSTAAKRTGASVATKRTTVSTSTRRRTTVSTSAKRATVSTTGAGTDHQHVESSFICGFCQMTFETRDLLNNHLTTAHIRKGDRKCPICSRVLKTPKGLKVHIESHVGEIYNCDECFFQSRSKRCLEKHRNRKHSNDRSFKCPECPRSYSIEDDLRGHMKSHKIELCYCDVCGKICKNFHFLYNHKHHQHKMTTKDMHFLRGSDDELEAEDKNDEDNSENEVPLSSLGRLRKRKTLSSGNLRQTRNSGDTPEHKCPKCKRSFKSELQFKYHVRQHCLVFRCEQCDAIFKNKAKFTKHMATHKNQETEQDNVVQKDTRLEITKVKTESVGEVRIKEEFKEELIDEDVIES